MECPVIEFSASKLMYIFWTNRGSEKFSRCWNWSTSFVGRRSIVIQFTLYPGIPLCQHKNVWEMKIPKYRFPWHFTRRDFASSRTQHNIPRSHSPHSFNRICFRSQLLVRCVCYPDYRPKTESTIHGVCLRHLTLI